METIVWVYVCTTLQGIMAILIHPILKSPVLPKIIARTSFLLTFMHGPLRSAGTSTGTALTDFIQAGKLMSSQVISFGLPPYTFVMLLPVFIFLAEGTRFQITFP